jgi:hypothetical protein
LGKREGEDLMFGALEWASTEVATNNYWAQENLWDNMRDENKLTSWIILKVKVVLLSRHFEFSLQ